MEYGGVATQDWVSINTLFSITVGRKFVIHNKGRHTLLVASSSTEPNENTALLPVTEGRSLSVHPNADEIWVRANDFLSVPFVVGREPTFSFTDDVLDPRVYSGEQAITVQPFVEANVKRGRQFEASTYTDAFPAAPTFIDTVFITGDEDVLIKAQSLDLDGAGVKIEVFKNPTYTGGTPIIPYNLSDAPTAENTTVTILAGVSTSDAGVRAGTDLYVLGNDTPSSSQLISGRVAGLDRRLVKNTTYLRRVTNLSTSSPQKVYTYTTWYEGDVSNDTL